jgi:antitoxin VapB
MALNVKNDRADRLARELAEVTGESMTTAITVALEERLVRERARRLRPDPADRLASIARSAHALPRFDERSADDILGYDEFGLPR